MTRHGSEPAGSGQRNDLLRLARLRTPSPSDRTRPMSQRELAEAVTAYVFRTTDRDVPLDRHYISRLERGRSRWPIADYRDALRAVLGAATDAELGFYIKRRVPDAPPTTRPQSHTTTAVTTASGPATRPADTAPVQVVVSPGATVILVPAGPAILTALVPPLACGRQGHGTTRPAGDRR